MHWFDRQAGYLAFVTGLSFVCAAVVLFGAWGRDQKQKGWLWLAAAAALQGLASWTALASDAGPTLLARLLLTAGTAGALIELGHDGFPWPRKWLPPRWAYAGLALVVLAAPPLGAIAYAVVALRVVVAAQAAALLVVCLLEGATSHKLSRPALASLIAVASYLPAYCLDLRTIAAPLAMTLAAALWLADRAAQTSAQRRSWLTQVRVPAAYAVLLIAGWFVLGQSSASEAILLVQDAAGSALGAGEAGPVAPTSPLAALAWKIGLTAAPIAVFVALIRAAAKLPFVH